MKNILKNNDKAITLIALVITIIILLILAGVVIGQLLGENGLITKSKMAAFVSEYKEIEESTNLYKMNKTIEETSNVGKVASVSEITKVAEETVQEQEGQVEETEGTEDIGEVDVANTDKNGYPTTVEKIENGTISETLKQTIINKIGTENLTNVELYKIDKNKIDTKIKDEYVIDINTGNVYNLKGRAIGGKVYHVPELGLDKNGEDKKDKEIIIDSKSLNIKKDERITLNTKVIIDGQEIIPEKEVIDDTLEDDATGEDDAGTTDETTDETTNIGELEWSTSDDNIVTVEKGVIKGINVGTATITATLKIDSSVKATCEVIVTEKESKIFELNTENASILKGRNITLTATYNGTKVANTGIQWNIDNTNIATIASGKITAVEYGQAILTATYNGETATCNVTVRDKITQIYTAEDMVQFRNDVNVGQTYCENDIKIQVNLMNDIDLSEVCSSTLGTWVPVGSTTKPFKGIFNGNNHTISGLYINATTVYQGLFGYGVSAEFYDIKIANANITSSSYVVGGLISRALNISIDNCEFSGKITCTGKNSVNYAYVGGIIGLSNVSATSTITNCTNNGEITATYHAVGGIAGEVRKGTLKKCINNGITTGKNRGTGGIIGDAGYYDSSKKQYGAVVIENCINNGIIYGQGTTAYCVGGISGRILYGSIVKKCKNIANITGEGKNADKWGLVGGIVGSANNTGNNLIENCENNGEITATYYFVGGIAGWNVRGNIYNCINNGNVTGKNAYIRRNKWI